MQGKKDIAAVGYMYIHKGEMSFYLKQERDRVRCTRDFREHRGKQVRRDRENYSCRRERKSVWRWNRNEEVDDIDVAISSITRMSMLLMRTRICSKYHGRSGRSLQRSLPFLA
ncbi:hypothetical protein BJV78DRAFT_1251033 [Lactifluus subvellereus]|nr:hypothetical protein BJV78DRAFT_1251033 [Lactifluus subvellereus]